MTKIDELGKELLTDPEVLDVPAFIANYPMAPKNPSNTKEPGEPNAWKLQVYIVGSDRAGLAFVVLSLGQRMLLQRQDHWRVVREVILTTWIWTGMIGLSVMNSEDAERAEEAERMRRIWEWRIKC
ncbi:hypothetical protein F5Y06DRAFT_274115 [Hypoxylon sp. FL0890]|nr:hypothetical protein F5Y06DRAFT_274115 [Hypoxylon sp. FL0890]